MKLVITGTPGTGKTTLAKAISEEREWPLIQANETAKRAGLVQEDGSVDVDELRPLILREIEGKKKWVAEGHLLCEIALPADHCLVLRCNPVTLEKRLNERGYPKRKTRGNVECEALDYCLVNAEENYASVTQADNTLPLTPKKALKRLDYGDEVRWPLETLERQKV